MGALPTPEPAGLRFEPYVGELREFLDCSGLRWGSPGDVFAVSERLQTLKPFAEDMASLVRSIVLREGGSMPHAQLLEILALAIGGEQMERTPQHYRQPLRQLLGFVTGVLRRPWNVPPGELAEVLPFPADGQPEPEPLPVRNEALPVRTEPVEALKQPPRLDPPPPTLEVRMEKTEAESELEPEPVAVVAMPPVVSESVPSRIEPQPAIQPVLSQDEPQPATTAVPFAVPLAGERDQEPRPSATAPWVAPAVQAERPKRAHWLSPSMHEVVTAGACAVLAAILLALALRPGSSLQSETIPAPTPDFTIPPTAIPTEDPAASQALNQTEAPAAAPTKPSAYGEAFAPAYTVRHSRFAGNAPAPQPAAQFVPKQPATPAAPAQPQSQTSAIAAETAANLAAASFSSDDVPEPPLPRGPVDVSASVMARNLLSAPAPAYPLVARIAHIHGPVVMQAVILTNGSVAATRVLRGHRLLRGAARNAVRRWRFRPYELNGHAIEVSTTVTVNFGTHS